MAIWWYRSRPVAPSVNLLPLSSRSEQLCQSLEALWVHLLSRLIRSSWQIGIIIAPMLSKAYGYKPAMAVVSLSLKSGEPLTHH